jgi:hypothetical protein
MRDNVLSLNGRNGANEFEPAKYAASHVNLAEVLSVLREIPASLSPSARDIAANRILTSLVSNLRSSTLLEDGTLSFSASDRLGQVFAYGLKIQ